MFAPRIALRSILAIAFCSLPLGWSLTSATWAQDPLGDPAAATEATEPAADGEAGGQPQQLTSEDVQRMFKEGEEALKAKDFQKALSTYDQLVRILKQQGINAQVFLPVVYTGRGQAFLGLEDPQSAKADLDAALQENSTYLPALIARGKLYFDLNINDAAMADFEAAQEQDRQNPDVQFGLGKAYVLLGGAQQAIKPLTYAIEADENNAEAYRLRSQAYSGVGKNEEADADIQKAISLEPDNHENHLALATILLREEKYPEAVQAVEDAIKNYKPKEKDSKDPFAQGYLTKAAVLLEVAKKEPDEKVKAELYGQALTECDRLLGLIDESPVYAQIRAAAEFRRGVCLRLMGKYGDAVAALTESINLNPDYAEAYFRRGICFYYMGEEDLAILDFKNAGNIEYTDPRPRLWEGFSYAKKGDYHEAIRAYGQALVESDRYVPAYVNRGLAYMMLGENEKALADLNAAVRLEPAEWTHYFKRGIAYERLGRRQQAADSFINAIRFYDKYPPAYRHAATALDALGHRDLAQTYRDKANEVEAEQKAADEKKSSS